MNQQKKLYDKIYNNPNLPKYGHTTHGDIWKVDILELNPESWLDVGCGHNILIKEVKKYWNVEDCLGVDFSCPSADENCDILDMPFEDKRWDFLTAFDVMEHLLPEQITKAFDEMKRVSKRFAFTICYVEAITIIDGENVHATVWPKDKWIDIIKQYGKLYDKSQPSFNEANGFFIGEWKK